ncbi:MAG: Calx-beta domain-containing protein [Actinomycetota bacterium]
MGARITRPASAIAVALAVTVVPAVDASQACATGHLGVRWGGFPAVIGNLGPHFFYVTGEQTGTTTVTVVSVGDDCSGVPVTATYGVGDPPAGTPRPASGGPAGDYQPKSGATQPLYSPAHGSPTEHSDTVTIFDDFAVEPVAEQARAIITQSSGYKAVPTEVPLYILDDDGGVRPSLEGSGPYDTHEARATVSVPVFRAGPAGSPASFGYTVAGSSAAPATEGQDFIVTSPQPLTFPANERVQLITLKIIDDGPGEPTEEVTVTLTDPSAEDPKSATIRIVDKGQAFGSPPESTLHHPNHTKKYKTISYRLREIHVFTKDPDPVGVVGAEFALRQTIKGGRCAWWAGKRFRGGSCGDEVWLATSLYQQDFFLYRLGAIRPSTGRIKNYTAFSRAVDADGNVESSFGVGRNENTFEVRRRKKKD